MLSESSTRLDQVVEFSSALQEIEPTEGSDDSLLDLSVDAFIVDDLEILIGAGLLDSGKHGVLRS